MRCCVNCFTDNDIQDRIRSLHEKGDCDFCGSKRIDVLDITKAREGRDGYAEGFVADFRDLVDQFTPLFSKKEFSKRSNKLANFLVDLTNSFKLNSTKTYDLLLELLPDYYKSSPETFDDLVIPTYLLEPDRMKKNSVFGKNTWKDFKEDIQYCNRFHSTVANVEMLTKFFRGCKTSIGKGELYVRARISPDGTPIAPQDMGAAPRNKSTSGRLNASGIGYLYLCNSEDVALIEIKAAINDICTIATYEIKEDLEVVDLSNISSIGIFQSELDKDIYLMNQSSLKDLDHAMRTSSGRERLEVEYVPTEYISDLIKSMGVDGIMYDSTVNNDSKDIVLFKEDKVKQLSGRIKSYRIDTLDYQKSKLKN
ncbi:RES family NAD+ phosphorylase [Levilactobacillus tujiorum]|uniref:RES family NAD+ phosphorylase n=1 Tax=Levilactobacillus tujiorum TaxID=2912243 RepID=A0ABX1L2E6_9LACO|nr:RES family NAD+ phosphorylase [Levilactobacillus tujiorum]MCH5464073.1 RES family NAD+ phosphorylase [Levilactobacillus tujiorum]NLR11173.1 RES family NAD+ phosphorylase [Lactobacillus sp. HBUAS51387]NLR29200.1 RES family NAD+ phosphorylase [Levilactobacillus tujiorum]